MLIPRTDFMLNTKNLLFTFFVLLVVTSHAQLTLSDNDYTSSNPLDCGNINSISQNFSDGTGNYAAYTNDTLVLCPDLTQGAKVSIGFSNSNGFVFNIHASDTLYIYDGPNTSSPLIGAYNTSTNPTGLLVQASWDNPSGCLTLVFISDGADQGQGWLAHVACDNPQQPFSPHIEAFKNGDIPNALHPLDSGYVDICFGDSVLFVAKPLFPNSFEINGFGYSQNTNNCTYNWSIGGISVSSNDSVWFKPPVRSGYYIDLRITDPEGLIATMRCKLRVSQKLNFSGTGPLEDSVCLGENTVLIGGVTSSDTVGISIPEGQFSAGGVFSNMIALPDGTGVTYSSAISISGFDNSTTFSNICDLDQLMLDIEHSYIGDIEITLSCPSGQTVSILNANALSSGLVPGGCGNSIDVSLGNDSGIDGGVPGNPIWTYIFSSCNATQGSICNELTNIISNDYLEPDLLSPNYGLPIQSMDTSGVYNFDGNLNNLIGCPLNGDWTITVRDNQNVDDGYIFQWGIFFDASLYPNNDVYQNYVMNDFWMDDPSIVSDQNDTLIVIQPTTPGYTYYTYHIEDDYGCAYDTTVSLFVRPLPIIFSDTVVCENSYIANGTLAFEGGVWSSPSSNITFSPSNTALNPTIVPEIKDGTAHVIHFTDNACGIMLSSTVTFPPLPDIQVTDASICAGSSYEIGVQSNSGAHIFTWYDNMGNQIGTGSVLSVSEEGQYILDGTNECAAYPQYHSVDTATISIKFCDLTAPNIIVLSSKSGNDAFFVTYEGIKEYECSIFNRWGNIVFQTSEPSDKWYGTSNGKTVDEGTYYYIIKAVFESNDEVTKQGFVQVKH
jgi:gliding motility-associated-like protein